MKPACRKKQDQEEVEELVVDALPPGRHLDGLGPARPGLDGEAGAQLGADGAGARHRHGVAARDRVVGAGLAALDQLGQRGAGAPLLQRAGHAAREGERVLAPGVAEDRELWRRQLVGGDGQRAGRPLRRPAPAPWARRRRRRRPGCRPRAAGARRRGRRRSPRRGGGARQAPALPGGPAPRARLPAGDVRPEQRRSRPGPGPAAPGGDRAGGRGAVRRHGRGRVRRGRGCGGRRGHSGRKLARHGGLRRRAPRLAAAGPRRTGGDRHGAAAGAASRRWSRHGGAGLDHQRDPEPAQLQLVARPEEAARDLPPVDEGPLRAPHVDDRDGAVGRHLDHRVDARDPVVVERQVRRRQPTDLDDVPGELLGPQQLVAPVHLEGDGRRHRG